MVSALGHQSSTSGVCLDVLSGSRAGCLGLRVFPQSPVESLPNSVTKDADDQGSLCGVVPFLFLLPQSAHVPASSSL